MHERNNICQRNKEQDMRELDVEPGASFGRDRPIFVSLALVQRSCDL